MRKDSQQSVAIIGAGASGTILAHQLSKHRAGLRVLLIEERDPAGLGLAYSTPSLRHLLNVPAGKLSALPDQPDDFLHWLQTQHDAEATADTFAPRKIFGQYLQSLLRSAYDVVQLRGPVDDCWLEGSEAVLTLRDGQLVRANRVVLALGNLEPKLLPHVHPDLVARGIYQNNAWAQEAYADLQSCSSVVLIGTGLTCVDVVLRLRELGFGGTIVALSRHGQFPARHAPYETLPDPVLRIGSEPKTSRILLRDFRHSLSLGVDWRAAIDSLRTVSNSLWLTLPVIEQQRFRRHLQRRWDVLRHRMAPCIAEMLDRELKTGSLNVVIGHVIQIGPKGTGQAEVGVRTMDGNDVIVADRVINCTGPSLDYRAAKSSLLRNLFSRELVTAGPLGTGLLCDISGALISPSNVTSDLLFTLGPGRQGVLFESIAIPEIAQQAAGLAALLSAT